MPSAKLSPAHYNYFRDYDPTIGRYVQSDPIGLYGGINTFAYAYDSPLRYFDQLGLEPGSLRQRGYPPPPPPRGTPGAGCGDKDSDCYVPDFYPLACEAHDQCYATPGKSRLHCDNQLWIDSFSESGPWPNVVGPTFFWLGVRLGGGNAYRQAQGK